MDWVAHWEDVCLIAGHFEGVSLEVETDGFDVAGVGVVDPAVVPGGFFVGADDECAAGENVHGGVGEVWAEGKVGGRSAFMEDISVGVGVGDEDAPVCFHLFECGVSALVLPVVFLEGVVDCVECDDEVPGIGVGVLVDEAVLVEGGIDGGGESGLGDVGGDDDEGGGEDEGDEVGWTDTASARG